MFREKLTKDKEKRGYLYIRESYYERDRRTLKRKPARLCDGSAAKDRGKYSKKKDIYCGKIHEIDIKKFESFEEFILKNHKDFLEFKLKLTFDELIDEFVKYLLYIYEIDYNDFENEKKKVYCISDGYLSKDIVSWLKKFKINGNFNNRSEFRRFYYRCKDCAIFDDDVINSLYLKMIPDVDTQEIKEEIEKLQDTKKEYKNFSNLKDFLKKG